MRVTYCKIITVLKEKYLTWQQHLRARNRNPKFVQHRRDIIHIKENTGKAYSRQRIENIIYI
jgi:hypothetical protein